VDPDVHEPRIETADTLDARPAHNVWVLGRLKPGVTREQAAADLTAISMDLAREYPEVNGRDRIGLARLGLVGDTLRGPTQAFAGGVMALACLVLLAVCANLASLLAARAADRSRELAIRLSIGAGRGRIVRQLLTESLVLAGFGGAAGWGLALTIAAGFSHWKPPLDVPAWVEIRPDARLFLFSAALSLAAGVLAGLAPCRQAWKSQPGEALKGAPADGRRRRLPLRDALVGVQVAICCALVACSFVAIRGLSSAFSARVGIEPRGVAVASFDLDLARYSQAGGQQFQRRALDAVERIPGVAAAAFCNTIPLSMDQSSTPVYREETTDFRPQNSINATLYSVSPGYFRAAGTRLLHGREFTWRDGAGAAQAAIVNQRLARLLTGSVNAVGKRFRFGDGPLVEIVGVVENGKYATLTEPLQPAVFQASTQSYDGTTMLLARSSLPEAVLAAEMRDAVSALDPHLPLYGVGSMSEVLKLAFLPSRAAVVALSAFGILALVLAITGIYGLAAYSVSRRVREIGIRVAVGASAGDVLRCVLRRMGWLVALGSAAGLVLAWVSGHVLAAVVYHASPHDPLVLGASALTLALAGVAASIGPARRALRIEPSKALRQD
jgi:predicted permease